VIYGRQGRAFVFDRQPARPREERVRLGRASYHLRHEVAHSEAAGGANLKTVVMKGVGCHDREKGRGCTQALGQEVGEGDRASDRMLL
jgi:hypothetical protein